MLLLLMCVVSMDRGTNVEKKGQINERFLMLLFLRSVKKYFLRHLKVLSEPWLNLRRTIELVTLFIIYFAAKRIGAGRSKLLVKLSLFHAHFYFFYIFALIALFFPFFFFAVPMSKC